MSPLYTPTTSLKDLASISIEAQGLKGETFTRMVPGAATILVSGTMVATLMPVRANVTITNVCVEMTVNAATLTLTRVGIYSPIAAGVLLASSADQSALFTSGAAKIVQVPLSTPYTPTADGDVYAALICVGTTPPTLWRGAGATAGHTTANVNSWVQQTGQTDLPGPATFSAAGNAFWFGWN